MPRIRSVHPGLFTDESFVVLSMAARVLLIGIWTDADDHGVFEWKPVSLKMRVFPADNLDIAALMAELVSANQVAKQNLEGREYGIIRNFCKWQRPKNPSYRHQFPQEWHEYVAFKGKSDEAAEDDSPITTPELPQRSRINTENSAQMEEGIGDEGGSRNGSGKSHSQTQRYLNSNSGGVNVKEAKPPKHGAISRDKRFIYFRSGTAEWTAYAEDYRDVNKVDPIANEHGGRWFKVAGEAGWLASGKRGAA